MPAVREVTTDAVAEQMHHLLQPLTLQHLTITNCSAEHARGDNSHYHIVAVSQCFNGLSRVKRHQLVYATLASLMPQPVHGLMLSLYAPTEWEQQPAVAQPPSCRRGKTH